MLPVAFVHPNPTPGSVARLCPQFHVFLSHPFSLLQPRGRRLLCVVCCAAASNRLRSCSQHGRMLCAVCVAARIPCRRCVLQCQQALGPVRFESVYARLKECIGDDDVRDAVFAGQDWSVRCLCTRARAHAHIYVAEQYSWVPYSKRTRLAAALVFSPLSPPPPSFLHAVPRHASRHRYHPGAGSHSGAAAGEADRARAAGAVPRL